MSGTRFSACVVAGLLASPPVRAAEPEAAPTFEWAVWAGGTLHDKTRGIALDADGNVLLTGEFTGTATFGEHSVTSAGAMDVFVAKIDPRGKFLWVRTGGGEKIDRGYAVATDPAGNCYVTGHFESPEAKFDATTVKSGGDYDLFVAKYDPRGKLVWIHSGGGPGYDYGHGIAADGHGNVFVTGAVVGEGRFAGEKLGHPGPAHVFCLALDGDGKLLWAHAADGTGSSSGHGVAADRKGNCYVGGYASGVSTFGGQKIANAAGQDVLVAKFDAKGKLGWFHAGHGSSSAMVHELTADAEGNVWASGMFKNELKLADRSVTNQGQHDLLLTSFDPAGKRLWTRTAGGAGIDYGLGVATDGKGNSFLTGSFAGRVEFDGTAQTSAGAAADIFVVKYDRGGTQRWFVRAGSDRTDHAYTIVSDGKGGLYLSGACSGPAKFGTHAVPHRGSNDIFLAKLAEKAPATKPELVDVLVGGQGGYHAYRIPSLVVAPNGDLLVFCEARKDSLDDDGDIDLVQVRSTDGGKTWKPHELVYEEGGNAKIKYGNPTAVVDADKGTIWLATNRDHLTEKGGRAGGALVLFRSDDSGKSWSKPMDITAEVKQPDWGHHAFGPGIGVQIQHGPHRGRLVLPANFRRSFDKTKPSFAHVVYSDDHGKTWKLGGVLGEYTNECQVAETLEKGESGLLINVRNHWGRGGAAEKSGKRLVARSTDGGNTWGAEKMDPMLPEPPCQASLFRYQFASADTKSVLLFANPAGGGRKDLTVRMSHDEGRTWPVSKLLVPGPAAYSCLTRLPDGRVGAVVETLGYKKLSFTAFDLKWLGE